MTFLLLLLVLAFIFSFLLSVLSKRNLKEVIIDTDGSLSDLLSIIYLSRCEGIKISGITTNGKSATEHVIGLLDKLKLEKIPVATGRSFSLDPLKESIWENINHAAIKKVLPFVAFTLSREADPLTAADFISAKAKENKSLEFLALSALTNIADALTIDKHLSFKRVFITKGVQYTDSVFKDNLQRDPISTRKVWDSTLNLHLLPFVKSTDLICDELFKEKIQKIKSPEGALSCHLMQALISFLQEPFFDFFTGALLLDPSCCRKKKLPISGHEPRYLYAYSLPINPIRVQRDYLSTLEKHNL